VPRRIILWIFIPGNESAKGAYKGNKEVTVTISSEKGERIGQDFK